jgi:hypothetical protein
MPTKNGKLSRKLAVWVLKSLNPNRIKRTWTTIGVFRGIVLRLGQQNIEIVDAGGA